MSSVDLTYQRALVDGTVGAEPVRFTMQTRHRSGSRGTSVGLALDVSWNIGDNHRNLDPITELHGTFAGDPVRLTGDFHLTDYYAFRYADITGSVGDDELSARIASVEAPAIAPATISIDGTFGSNSVTLYASIEGDLSGGRIEGLVGGRPMKLNAIVDRSDGHSVDVVGEYDGPAALLTLLVGALIYFL